jgi:hypothetical protein
VGAGSGLVWVWTGLSLGWSFQATNWLLPVLSE